MEQTIIDWLDKNNYRDNQLIDSVLILSLNGLFISSASIINYCNQILDDENEIEKEKEKENEIIKKKRKIDNENNFIELNNNCNYYGLNKNQFQIISNNLNSLKNSIVQDKNGNKIVLSKYQNFNKFDFSIKLIIENNKKHNSKNGNNENGSGSNDLHERLFFQVWKNKYILSNILFHTRLYNLHIGLHFNGNLNELFNYKYRNYLANITFKNDVVINSFLQGSLLPSSLTSISFPVNVIIPKLDCNSLPKSLTSINFGDYNRPLDKSLIPSSVTSITFGPSFNQSLDGGWIPDKLKHLEFGLRFAQSFLPGQLPKTLRSLLLSIYYSGIIIPGSIPDSVTTLKYVFNSNSGVIGGNEVDLSKAIPKHTTCLVLNQNFDQIIKVGDIPHNVTSIVFGQLFNSLIEPGSLPHSIRFIKFGSMYDQELNVDSLPPNCKSVKFGRFNHVLTSRHLPSTLTSITFGTTFNRPIDNQLFQHTCLTSLDLGGFDNIIEINSFPDTLTSLEARHFNRPLVKDCLPKSLKSLVLSEFNHPITQGSLPVGLEYLRFHSFFSRFNQLLEVGSLPNSLKSLSFGDEYNQPFNSHVLPYSLQSLQVGFLFTQDLSNVNCLPQSLTQIDIGLGSPLFNDISTIPHSLKSILYTDDNNIINTNYLNSIDFNIFFKYFKYYKSS